MSISNCSLTADYYSLFEKYLYVAEKLNNSKIEDLALELEKECAIVCKLYREYEARKDKIKKDREIAYDVVTSVLDDPEAYKLFLNNEIARIDFIKQHEANHELGYAYEKLQSKSSQIKKKVKKEVGKQDIISLEGYF